MKMPTTMRWVALALLGVLVAVGVSIAASGLVSQQIGLSSEPISAGDALAPAVRSQAAQGGEGRHRAPAAKAPSTARSHGTTEAQPPAEPPATTPVTPVGSSPSGGEEDHGGGDGHADD